MNASHVSRSQNEWQACYSGRRRAIDKALLEECERQIAQEERSIPDPVNPTPPVDRDDMRLAIARAFGRPIN